MDPQPPPVEGGGCRCGLCERSGKLSEIFHNRLNRENRLQTYADVHKVYVAVLERALALQGQGE